MYARCRPPLPGESLEGRLARLGRLRQGLVAATVLKVRDRAVTAAGALSGKVDTPYHGAGTVSPGDGGKGHPATPAAFREGGDVAIALLTPSKAGPVGLREVGPRGPAGVLLGPCGMAGASLGFGMRCPFDFMGR